MAAEADAGGEGYEQWKYSIYLVGFPASGGDSDVETKIALVTDMIQYLVPEARIFAPHSFGGYAALNLPDLFTEDDDGPVEDQEGQNPHREGRGSAIDDQNTKSTSGEVNGREEPDGSDFNISKVDSVRHVAVKEIEPLLTEDKDTIGDSVFVTSLAVHQSSPNWIEEEALTLLRTIQKNASTERTVHQSKLLLAGYGFGGMVVKQAVIIANTNPNYYDVALNISNLVFLATPHRSTDRLAWEKILLDLIKATKTSYGGWLLHTLPRLVDTVSRLSHVFYRFAARYPTTNFIEGKGFGNSEPVVGKLGIFDNNLEDVVTWAENDFNSLMFCAVDDLDKLESLRSRFAPAHLSNQSTSEHLSGVSQVVIHDIYFEALQSLSPSRWILYEHRTLDEPHDLSELKEIYRSLLSDISWKEVCENGSIQVTGPAGYGKSSLVKLLSQDIRQRSSVVVIENLLGSYERLRPTLYGVYVSSIHQIISQRPSLFLPVQNLIIEILRQETWTEESIWILLSAILQHSRAVNFLIVIYDFEDWPSEIRSWWSETLGPLVKSFGSSFTFLISSHRPINDLTSEPPHELNLEMEYERYREDFIRVKTNNLLDHAFGSVIDPQGLSDHVKKKIVSTATSFQGSFPAINTYLVLLFQNFTLNTLDAIVNEIESSPETEESIYEREITTLRMKSPRVFSWASSAISWMLSSIRQLRIEELGAAVAVSLDTSSLTNLRSGVSTNMERDLQNHLGHVVTIENRYARITSALTKEFLSRDETRHSLGIQNDCGLTRLCLHYVTLVLEDTEPETWQKCLSRISWKYKTPAPQDPAFEFLHYACRFWPTHFLLIKEPESSLKDAVIKFLLAPKIGERWFQLYQLCISHSANLLIGDQEARGPAIAFPEAELAIFRRASLVRDAANIDSQGKAADARQMAVHMAGYIGLASIIPEILGSSVPARGFRMINVRRGYSQRAVACSDSDSQYYLDCAICNDDDNLVKELLDSDRSRIPKYFPLHKAAQAGCFKTVQTLFNKLEHPAEINEDGRTPLHQAAIGGSTKIIRFILGKDTFDTRWRRIDVPNMIDIKDCKSQTPLIIATRMGNIEAAKILIECGADLAIRDDAGKTALHYAVFNCSETVQDFATPGLTRTLDDGDCTLLHTAAISGNMQTISTLISALRRSHYLKTAINAEDSQGKTPLLYAAEYGYTEIVKTLLINEASMELDDETYQQAANIAAKHGHVDTVKFFISADEHIRENRLLQAASSAGQLLVVEYLLHNHPASLDSDQSQGPGPISLAASKGHNEVVRTLLRYNVSVNIEDDTGQTPLHHAAKNGRCRVMRTLLHHHANVDAPDMEGNTPLHSAAMAGRVRVIELLIRHAADLEARSRTEETALHLAVKSRKSVEALLKAGAKRDAIDRLGQTPLHIAAREECYQSVDLLRCPENINARDYDGRLPLYHAIVKKDLEKVKALRPDLLESEDRIHLALEWAVQSSAPNVLDLLLNVSSESVNEPDGDGRTIIHVAAELESLEVLTILLEAKSKPDVNLTCEMERTPLHYAAIKGRVENMRYLIEKGAEVDKADNEKQTPLHMAAINDQGEAVAVLLEGKADIDLQDSEQQTSLYLAACYGCIDVAKRLLEENADVKLVSSDGWSPLHAAADNPEIAEMLIAHEADINLPKQDMWTPLHLATNWSELAVAKLLVEKGANLDVVTDDGNTALHLAIIGDNASLVQLILEKGANFKIKTRDDLSCLVLAVSNSSVNILDILLDAGKHSRSGTAWDFEDMAAAYWQAIEEQDLEALQVLVKKEGQLPDELSDEGFTGLETCLRNRRDEGEEEPVAIYLLKLGADPYKRRQVDQKSGFELGIISRRKPKLEFMDACLERVPEDLSSTTACLGFKELRIATELHKLDLWKRLEPLREAVWAEVDHDGWSLDHFIYQSADRLPAQLENISLLESTKVPTGLVVPPIWLPPAEALVKIAPSRLQASFETTSEDISLRADFPFPPRRRGPVYFEITILPLDDTAEWDITDFISLGFCGEFCDLTQAQPGWNAWSVGYHGDNGCIYEEIPHSTYSTGRKFGPGNTVGCGIDYDKEEYFFTLGAEVVAHYSAPKVIYRKLYPAIGHCGQACEVKLNFGEDDFVWPDINKQKESNTRPPKLQRKETYRDRRETYQDRSRSRERWYRDRSRNRERSYRDRSRSRERRPSRIDSL